MAWLPPAAPGFAAAERLLAVGGWAQDEAGGAGCHVVCLLSQAAAAPPAPADGDTGADARSQPPPPAPKHLVRWRHAGAVADLHVRRSSALPKSTRVCNAHARCGCPVPQAAPVPGSPGEAVLLAASAGGALSRIRLRLPHSAAGESLGDAEVRAQPAPRR